MGTRGRIALGLVAVLLLSTACLEEEKELRRGDSFCEEDKRGCVKFARSEPILLGTMLDRSGPMSDIGQDSLHGVLLAADYIDGSFDGENARLLGHEIAFVHKDERCTPRGGKYGARELISQLLADGLLAVIGGTCDAGTLGVADQIFSDEGVTLISPSITRPDLTGPDRAEFFFRTAHNGTLESQALGVFAAEQLSAEIATLVLPSSWTDNTFGRTFLRDGGSDTIPIDFTTHVPTPEELETRLRSSMKSDPPDAIYLPADPRFQVPTIRVARDSSLRKVALLVEEHRLPKPKVFDHVHPAQDVYIARPHLKLGGLFYEEEFLPAYRARFGEPTSAYHAHAFDATLLVLRAIKKVAILDETDNVLMIPRTALRDALAKTKNFEGISGNLTCDDSGDCNPDAPMIVRKFENGRFTVVWRSVDRG